MQSTQYSVDVFNDLKTQEESAWFRLGAFKDLDKAIVACKQVIDKFLIQHKELTSSPNHLATSFLMYGPVPRINGAENIKAFDTYEYLDKRCSEIFK